MKRKRETDATVDDTKTSVDDTVPAVDATTEPEPEPEPVRLRVATRKRSLRCMLTSEEINERARDLAKAQQDIEAEEARQKSIKKTMAAELDALHGRRSALASTVASGCEYRDVVVRDIYDYVDVTVSTIRTDTGEETQRRTMTDQERQQPLPGMPMVDEDDDLSDVTDDTTQATA